MAENILTDLVKTNEFPILFIGAGMSRRYLKDYPDWDGLLKTFWNQVSKSHSIIRWTSRDCIAVERFTVIALSSRRFPAQTMTQLG